MTQDGRMHIPVRDIAFQKRIKEVMAAENLSYEELVQKYFKLPQDDLHAIHEQHEKVNKMLYSRFTNQDISDLMNMVWGIIVCAAKDQFDIKMFNKMLEQDFDKYTIKR